MPILATMTITPRDRTFEFDYTGTVPYDVIDKMERTCLLLQGLKGMPLKVKYNVDEASFLACEALYDMLHWGTTEARNVDEAVPQEVPQEVPQAVPQEVPQEVPQAVPQEVPHVDEATSSNTQASIAE